MLLGVDYPYWATFNLQTVFPNLEDFLNREDFPVSTVYNQVIQDWPTLRPSLSLFSTPDLVRQFRTLYGAYLLALSKGASRYEQHPSSTPPFKTVPFIVSETGINRQTVVAFLSTVEKLAKAGGIDQRYWDPARTIVRNSAVTHTNKMIDASKPQSQLDKVVKTSEYIGFGLLGGLGLWAFIKAVHLIKG